MAEPQSVLYDSVFSVILPFAVSTLAFMFLIWLRDTPDFGEKWPIAFVASGVIGVFALVGFVGRRSKTGLGIWRDLI